MAGLGDSILRPTAPGAQPGDELKVGAAVSRTHFSENRLSVAAINRKDGIIVLRREGGSAYIGGGSGSVYSAAAMIVCSYWERVIEGTNRTETWCRQICEAPIKKGAKL